MPLGEPGVRVLTRLGQLAELLRHHLLLLELLLLVQNWIFQLDVLLPRIRLALVSEEHFGGVVGRRECGVARLVDHRLRVVVLVFRAFLFEVRGVPVAEWRSLLGLDVNERSGFLEIVGTHLLGIVTVVAASSMGDRAALAARYVKDFAVIIDIFYEMGRLHQFAVPDFFVRVGGPSLGFLIYYLGQPLLTLAEGGLALYDLWTARLVRARSNAHSFGDLVSGENC